MQNNWVIIFDWGDTLMYDFPQYQGPMVEWPQVKMLPRVAETLADLQGKVRCCVASNAGDSNAVLLDQALQRVSINHYFEQIFTSQELGRTKHEVLFYHAIAERMGVLPSQCIMVGNTYEVDIQPAKQAGMTTIWLCPNQPLATAQYADAVISSFADLPAVIQQLIDVANL